MKWDESESTRKKSNSPFSIYFYLKRNSDDLEKSKVKLSQFLSKREVVSHFQVEYWTKKGYSEDEAKQIISKNQIKNANHKRKTSPYDTEVYNISQKNKCSIEEAKEIANKSRRDRSPRLLEYWLNKGYSKQEANEKRNQWCSDCSPRTINYWIKKGLTREESKIKVSEHQDKISVTAIEKRYNCSELEARKIQMSIIKKHTHGQWDILFNEDEELHGRYLVYRTKVQQLSNKVYKYFKNEIDPKGIRGRKYHLDHIVSIMDGFVFQVPLEIICSKFNLRIISENKNCSKSFRSDQEIDELIRKYYEYYSEV